MPITDAFTGTNGDGVETYSSNWAYVKGSGDNLQIQSNGITLPQIVDLECAAQRTEAGFPSDHYAQVSMPVTSIVDMMLGVAVRCQGADTQDYYGFYSRDDVSQLFENDGATWTQLGSNGAGINTAQTLRLTVAGTTLTPAVAGATQNPPGAQTDATFANGSPGVAGWNSNNALNSSRMDDFECSDVAGLLNKPPGARNFGTYLRASGSWRS